MIEHKKKVFFAQKAFFQGSKKGTSILIVGIMFFFFMTVLLTLTLSVVEEIGFEAYAGKDAQLLTAAKYQAEKTEFFIEKSSEIYFKERLSDFDSFKDYLSSSSLEQKNDEFYLERNNVQNYTGVLDLYENWYLSEYKSFLLTIQNKVRGMDDFIPIKYLNYSLIIEDDKLIGFYSGYGLNELNSPRHSKYVNVSGNTVDNIGKLYFKPHFTVNLNKKYFEFKEFIKNFTIARNDLELSCDTLTNGEFEDDKTEIQIITNNAIRTVILTRYFNGLKFRSEFTCQIDGVNLSPSSGTGSDSDSSTPGSTPGSDLPGEGSGDDSGNIGGSTPGDLGPEQIIGGTVYFDMTKFNGDNGFLLRDSVGYATPSECVGEEVCICEYDNFLEGGRSKLISCIPKSPCISREIFFEECGFDTCSLPKDLSNYYSVYTSMGYTDSEEELFFYRKLEDTPDTVEFVCDSLELNYDIVSNNDMQIKCLNNK